MFASYWCMANADSSQQIEPVAAVDDEQHSSSGLSEDASRAEVIGQDGMMIQLLLGVVCCVMSTVALRRLLWARNDARDLKLRVAELEARVA